MQDLFNLIETNQFACEFTNYDFSKVDKFKFDNNNKFIIYCPRL